jgi:hypothetical protein
MEIRSLYGFSPNLEPFVDKTPAEQVALLQSWGNTAIFGGYQNPEFVAAAHAVGMLVFAEFGCFVHKKWWDEEPESRPIACDGTPLEPEDWYYGVNPATPAVRQRQLMAMEDLLANCALDGVWLDFIRWPCHWEVPEPNLPLTSFDAQTVARFCRETGIDAPTDEPSAAAREILDNHQAEWTSWRCDQVTSWVAQARTTLDRTRPGAVLGMFGVPWRLGDYSGAILSVIGQDYRTLSQHIDVFSPMVYHAMCGFPIKWIGEVVAEVRALSGKPVCPIIQSVDEPRALTPEEYASALDVALDHPASEGVIVFTLKGALEKSKQSITQARFTG